MTNRISSQDTTVPGQSYLSSSISGVLQGSNCRRGILAMGEGDSGTLTPTNSDVCLRYGLTLPVTPYRFRLRIRNSNLKANTTQAGAVTFIGVAMGPANVAETAWAGDFTATPTSLGISGSNEIGTSEYVSSWIAPSTLRLQAGTFYGLSIGLTCASVPLNSSSTPGWVFQGTGASAAWQSQAAPSGGAITANPYLQYLDVRMEFEYVGANEIGLFIGASVCSGWLQTIGGSVATGHMGPDNSWPHIAGLRLGHNDMNGGVGGAQTSVWSGTPSSSLCWSRFFSPESSDTTFACIPDYAVISDLAETNSADTGSNPLSTFQTGIETIIASLNALGITRIYLATGTPGYTVQLTNIPTYQAGQLMEAVSSTSPDVAIVTEGGQSYGPGQIAATSSNTGTNVTLPLPNTGSFVVGQSVVVTGASGGAWGNINGTWTIITVTSAHIIFTVTNAPSGTYTASSAVAFAVAPFGFSKGGPGTGQGQPGSAGAWYASSGGPFNFFLGTPQAPVGGPYVASSVAQVANGWPIILGTSSALTTAPAGTPVMTASEYYRELLNQYVRTLPPGIIGVLDFAAEVASQYYYPSAVGRPEYYSNSGDAHPTGPGMYNFLAQIFTQGITGT